jgi:hypothetical protein
MDKAEIKLKDDDMQNLLMQSIVERLEGLELLLHASLGQKSRVDQAAIINELTTLKREIQASYSKLLLDRNAVHDLKQSLTKLEHQLSVPRDSKIEYKHILHKGIWFSAVMTLVVLLVVGGWMSTYDKLNWYKEGSIKYRYLKAFGNEGVIKFSMRTDSLYNLDNGSFYKKVVSAEQKLQSRADSLHLAVEKTKWRKNNN